MPPKVASTDSGTDTAGTRVARRLRRNRNTTSTTNTVDRTRVSSTSRTELRIEVVVSWIISRFDRIRQFVLQFGQHAP